MNDYKLPPLPNLVTHEAGCFDPTAFVVPLTEVVVRLHQYAEAATAPLLQDLAAHEASNRIKTENLETLRDQNETLREALERLVDTSARVSKLGAMTGPQWLPFGVAITRARAALGESNG
ncbi:hypothetical protein [Schauerella aestuarii]|uniref:hypothetical protein n=1 Tax=Schauerella aestuarii TaxID=2511204 RepID=UPI00136B30FD|nr:hypothetical protein [Achromobacter aestuarii]MYZ41379.1 hypothetical protein [Achromobacter aestuarii]